MSKHVVVTGGAGFIGSHLCERLLRDGFRVTCIDNLFSGDRENIRHLEETNRGRFRFVEKDVREPIDYVHHVDEIYNLACPASPIFYQSDPVLTMLTCVLGARSVLELARHYNAKVLQASTSEVYGDPDVHPQTEGYNGNVNPIGDRACYDEGKRAAETIFFDYHRQRGVRIKVARIFNTYGPRMSLDDGRVVSNFIVQALKNEPITIYGDGSQTRSFCYVDDLVEGLVRLMGSADRTTGPCNLGNPNEMTIMEIAKTIRQIVNSHSELVQRDLPQDDPRRRKPDISRAFRLLGWSPKVNLTDGLTQTIRYFAEHENLVNHAKRVRPAMSAVSK